MHLEVVTPKGTALSAEVDEVTAPGALGEFGVLPGHTPLLASLKAGALKYRTGTQNALLAIGPGFAEVSGHDRVVILTEMSTTPDGVDVDATKRELDEVERKLKDPNVAGALDSPEHMTLEARRAWAQARLDAHAAAKA